MRIGVITDIHSQAAALEKVLRHLVSEGAEKIVTIGDSIEAFGPAAGAHEVAEMLKEHNVIGVWGNHDYSLCQDDAHKLSDKYSLEILNYMRTLQPRLELGSCYFSHKESSVNPMDVQELWDISEDEVNLTHRSQSAFRAQEAPWQFVGHYHRWWAATPEGPLSWEGRPPAPLHLTPLTRYFLVIAPVFDGCCALIDTDALIVHPYQVAPNLTRRSAE